MNKRPIEQARDHDLRQSGQALRRAAQRARELAAQTGTVIVVSHNGTVKRIAPTLASTPPSVQAPPASYGEEA